MPSLEPVDYDPFAGLQPVDYDPWDGRPMPSTYEESRMDAAQRRLEPVDHNPFADVSNLEAADKTLNLTPQERALYQRHLTNLNGPDGVDNPNGSRSTLFQMSFEQDGKTYNIPTVWDGKILNPDDAIKRAEKEGLDKFPSYGSENGAEARYQRMHDYMERDTGAFLSRRAASQAAATYNDPFSSAPAPSSRAQEKFGRIADAVVAGAKNWIETPGRAMREGITTDQAVDWAAPTAMGMVAGSRLAGGAPEGALGSSGAKLVQPEGIRAYHGSPHDFDRFSLDKIGTGEGAQAYGHGIYLAENEGVARGYRDRLAHSNTGEFLADYMLKQVGGDYDKARALIRAESPTEPSHIGALAAIDKLQETNRAAHGRMYEVNIGAKPEQFLDWDKPWTGQPKEIQDIALASGIHPDSAGPMGTRVMNDSPMGQLAGRNLQNPNSLINNNLKEAGIPGIRYLDQGSRIASDAAIATKKDNLQAFKTRLADPNDKMEPGLRTQFEELVPRMEREIAEMERRTHNYVVFDPGIIDILRKYGLAGGAALGAASLPDQDKPQ